MQLILKPIGQPHLDEIIVNDTLFAVGRHEKPFDGYDSRLVTRLSRRHARIFEQDGAIYLADLGSLNGTTVDGRSVDKAPVELRPGAEVCFAKLCYQVEILGSAANQPLLRCSGPTLAALVLMPRDPGSELEPIVVTQFPFLVSKRDDVFARFCDRWPDEVNYLSRRHAHIFLRDNTPYIEDLGSTNGTYLSGVRIEEHARPLRNGDIVAFGGDFFVYTAELAYRDATVAEQALEPTHVGISDSTRTTFVTSASSFLDIFCVDDGPKEDDPSGARSPAAGATATAGEKGAGPSGRGWLARISRVRSSLGEVRQALADEAPARPRRRRRVFLALAAAAAVAIPAAVYIGNATTWHIEALIAAGRYQQAVEEANTYLAKHPGDREVADMATGAWLKAVASDWTDLVTTAKYAAARARLQTAMRGSSHIPAVGPLIDTMEWVTDIEQLITERGGAEAPISVFEPEEEINALLDWWESDSDGHNRSLGTIVREVPEFAELRARVFSHQRLLQSHRALEFAAISRLREDVSESLTAGRGRDLVAVLSDFKKRYPRIGGVGQLEADLHHYLPVEHQIEARDWLEARETLTAADFQTPPFRTHTAYLLENVLPSDDVLDKYRQASAAWREGHFEAATRLLDELSASRWSEPARRQLKRQARIRGEYAQLGSVRNTPEYEERLLSFYALLDAKQDGYFLDRLRTDVETHREKALARARQAFQDAAARWNEYRDKGGIQGRQRLEIDVSATFRSLATALSEAYGDAVYGRRIYGLLGAEIPAKWDELYGDISNEVGLQRRSLAELSLVLEPSLQQAKLRLIPAPEGGRSYSSFATNPPGAVGAEETEAPH